MWKTKLSEREREGLVPYPHSTALNHTLGKNNLLSLLLPDPSPEVGDKSESVHPQPQGTHPGKESQVLGSFSDNALPVT